MMKYMIIVFNFESCLWQKKKVSNNKFVFPTLIDYFMAVVSN